jgi:hypothetical protein
MARKQRVAFVWRGTGDGHPAPPGQYHFRVLLIHQRRTIDPVIVGATDSPASVTLKESCPAA